MNSPENIQPQQPSSLLGQFGLPEDALRAMERCAPNQLGFIPAGTHELLPEILAEMADGLKIAYCFDGSFLPVRNGCSYTLYNLMRAVADSQEAKPLFVVCDRGTDDTASYYDQKFSTLFLHPDDYYGSGSLFTDALQAFGISAAQFYSSEGMLNIAPKLRAADIRTIFEIQNTDYALLEQLGADKTEVAEAYRKQVAAQKLADLIFVRSEQDANQALQLGADVSRLITYRGGITVDDIGFHSERTANQSLVFLGNMHYAPNQRAVEHIAQTILPALDEAYRLTIVGMGPPELVRRYEAAGASVYSVDDLSAELQKHQFALAPLTEGSGTRLKLLDYLASGITTLTTTIGVEGLDSKIAESVIVEDDISRHARIIQHLQAHPEEAFRRAQAGRRFVERNYSWSGAVITFTDAYKELYVDTRS